MRRTRLLAAAFALLTLTGSAQTAQPKPELLLFHPSGPPLSYEVATIKPIDPNTADRVVRLPPGVTLSPLSIRRYIMNAYGAMYAAQVVGGPDWINKDAYDIKGKFPDDLEAASQTMKRDDRIDQDRAMQQSLLADRFQLKAALRDPRSARLRARPCQRRPQDHRRPRAARAQTRRPAHPNTHRRTSASRLFDDHSQQQRPRPQWTRHPNVLAGPYPLRRNRRPSHRRSHRLHRLLRHQATSPGRP